MGVGAGVGVAAADGVGVVPGVGVPSLSLPFVQPTSSSKAAAQQGAPPSLVGKLPIEFKRLGLDTHQRFDQLALNIETFEETGQALPELAELMNNCTACHTAYRFELEQP